MPRLVPSGQGRWRPVRRQPMSCRDDKKATAGCDPSGRGPSGAGPSGGSHRRAETTRRACPTGVDDADAGLAGVRTQAQVRRFDDPDRHGSAEGRVGSSSAEGRAGSSSAEGRAGSGSSSDGELVLGVADPLLDLPAVGGRIAALDRLELRLRLLELLAAPVRRRSPPPRRRRRRARSPGPAATWKKPGPVANSSTSPSLTCTRVEPALSVAISGACRASTPISPAAPGTIIISASPS